MPKMSHNAMEAMVPVISMNKGTGENSYAKNSSLQSKIITIAWPASEEAVMDILVNNFPGESMGIAELGCSSGPNAVSTISRAAKLVHAMCRQLGRPPPELRLYLNDLPSADFNCVFGSLRPLYDGLEREHGAAAAGRCFVMGVPGSFYGRLFPSKSLHFVHSSSSLHWLSKVPHDLFDGHENPMNKGKIYISKTSPRRVLDAYSVQFQKDFYQFLESRSEEVVEGGRMVVSLLGRRPSDPPTQDYCCDHWELLAKALITMASEGRVEEEKIDSFNLPWYVPSSDELRKEIKKQGSFAIERVEVVEIDWDEASSAFVGKDEQMRKTMAVSGGERVAKMIRSALESMLEFHFGKDMIDLLFQRYAKIVGHHLSYTRPKYVFLVISLTRKAKSKD